MGRVYKMEDVRARGLPIISRAKINKAMAATSSGRRPANNPAPSRTLTTSAYQPAEYDQHGASTADGTLTEVKLESAKGGDFGLPFGQINVVLTNTTAEVKRVTIGDGANFLSGEVDEGGLGIPANPAGVTVGGRWGTSTLDRIREGARAWGYRFSSIFISTTDIDGNDDVSFYNSGKLLLATASPVGDSPTTKRIELATGVTQSTRNKDIRRFDNISIHFDALRGLVCTIPPGVVLSMSFGVSGVGTGKAMETPS